MAQPLQYQSQFIPTDFNTVGNMLGMFRQDMAQRDQMFDQGVAMEQKLLADLYGLETFQPEIIGERVDKLAERMQEAVARRGGDYGAAAKDIARLGTRELSDPIYKLNQRQVEQAKLLEQTLARNPNLMVLRDPRTMGLSPNMTMEDINYSVLDPEEAKRRALELTKYLDTSRIAGIRTDPSGMYNIGITHRGPTEQQVQELMADPAMAQQLQSYFPQTQGMDSEELTQFFTNTLGDAARSYQREPEERILGLNPYFTASLKQQQEGDLKGGIQLRGVGASGIENLYPINKPKDFWNAPADNSQIGLMTRSIARDIEEDSEFLKNNKQYQKEFGDIFNAKKVVNNYSPKQNITDTTAVQDFLEDNPDYLAGVGAAERYSRLAELYQDLMAEGKLDPNAGKINREEYQRAKEYVDNFEEKLNERLFLENSDLQKRFKHFDTLTGDTKTNTATKTRMKDFQEYTGDYLTVDKLQFELSNNKDINFEDQDKLLKKGDPNYLKAQEGDLKIAGIAVDPYKGVKIKVITTNADGGTTTHIASPKDEDIEETIMDAYVGGDTENPMYRSWVVNNLSKRGAVILENLDQFPHLNIPPQAKTIGEYKNYLKQQRDMGLVNDMEYGAIISYLSSIKANDNTSLAN